MHTVSTETMSQYISFRISYVIKLHYNNIIIVIITLSSISNFIRISEEKNNMKELFDMLKIACIELSKKKVLYCNGVKYVQTVLTRA